MGVRTLAHAAGLASAAAMAVVCVPAAMAVETGAARITGCTDPDVSGTAKLVELPSEEGVKTVWVHVTVKGLPPGKHGVHIHERAACVPCSAAGGHFDPGPSGNSSPDGNHPFHSGDLPNLEAKGRVGALSAMTTRVTLSPGPLSLFDADGSAIIVHVGEDTYCTNGPEAGCAGGARAACGIIERID